MISSCHPPHLTVLIGQMPLCRRFVRRLCLLGVFAAIALALPRTTYAQSGSAYNVGDRVEVHTLTGRWYPAVIKTVYRRGSFYSYTIRYDDGTEITQDQNDNMRLVSRAVQEPSSPAPIPTPTPAPATDPAAPSRPTPGTGSPGARPLGGTPPNGRYICWRLKLMEPHEIAFDLHLLPGGRYSSIDVTGTYRYTSSTRTLVWLTGTFATARTNWVGVFVPVGPDARYPTIRIRDRGDVAAGNKRDLQWCNYAE